MMNFFCWIIAAALSFLSGSIMYCIFIPKLLCKKDVQALSEDKNPGAANVFLHCGIAIGFLCLSLDMLKGFVPIYLTYRTLGANSLLFGLVLAAPVLGHAVAPFNHFHGGKCISTAFGSLLAVLPIYGAVYILAVLYILFSTILKINPNRIRSIITFLLFALISVPLLIYHKIYFMALGCLIISTTVIVKHVSNPV